MGVQDCSTQAAGRLSSLPVHTRKPCVLWFWRTAFHCWLTRFLSIFLCPLPLGLPLDVGCLGCLQGLGKHSVVLTENKKPCPQPFPCRLTGQDQLHATWSPQQSSEGHRCHFSLILRLSDTPTCARTVMVTRTTTGRGRKGTKKESSLMPRKTQPWKRVNFPMKSRVVLAAPGPHTCDCPQHIQLLLSLPAPPLPYWSPD